MALWSGAPLVESVALLALLSLLGFGLLAQGLFFPAQALPVEAGIGGLAVAVAAYRAAGRGGLAFVDPLDWCTAGYAAGFGLSAWLHPAAPDAALRGALTAGALWLVYRMGSWLAGREAGGRFVANFIVAAGSVLALTAWAGASAVLDLPNMIAQGRLVSTLQYANAFAALLIAAAICAAALAGEVLQRPEGRYGQAALGAYGACLALLLITLIGTYSRAGWIVFLLTLIVWTVGLPSRGRSIHILIFLWCLAAAVVLARPALDAVRAAGPPHAVGAVVPLMTATLLGAVGPVAYRRGRRVWRRADWSPAVRGVLRAGGAVVVGVAVLLVLLTAIRAVAVGGHGILGSSVLQRLRSVRPGAASVVIRLRLWRDALRLIAANPFAGYGAGGWNVMYHRIQSTLYWSSLVHESVLEAWLGGGILAAAAMACVGPLLLKRAWSMRAGQPWGGLYWGLAVGAFGLWAHALFDFDLSFPALAAIVWLVAGVVGAGPRAGPGGGPAPVAAARIQGGLLNVLAGLAAVGVVGLLVMGSALRENSALRLATFAGSAMNRRAYGLAYQAETQAIRLDPRSAPERVDLAQLLLIADEARPNAAVARGVVTQALAAIRLDPGDLTVRSQALDVLVKGGDWAQAMLVAPDLERDFALDPDVYAAAGAAYLVIAQSALTTHRLRFVNVALNRAAGTTDSYTNASLGRSGIAVDPYRWLPSRVLIPQGAADAMLGRWSASERSLEGASRFGNPDASGWLAAVWQSLGIAGQVRAALNRSRDPSTSGLVEAGALRWIREARAAGVA